MLSNNLRCFVAFEALRSCIPCAHATLGIQHKDRVILHGIDKETGSFFTSSESDLGAPAFAQVARDFSETKQLPPGVSHRRNSYVRPKFCAVLPDSPALVLCATFLHSQI